MWAIQDYTWYIRDRKHHFKATNIYIYNIYIYSGVSIPPPHPRFFFHDQIMLRLNNVLCRQEPGRMRCLFILIVPVYLIVPEFQLEMTDYLVQPDHACDD